MRSAAPVFLLNSALKAPARKKPHPPLARLLVFSSGPRQRDAVIAAVTMAFRRTSCR